MGHERIGFLPRSQQWRGIVVQLSMYDGNKESVLRIANDTLNAIRKVYENMPFDESVVKAVSYLATLAFSAKQANQVDYLNENGYSVDSSISLFSLMASAQKYITTENGSLEVNKIAKDAALQAVMQYQQNHQTNQTSFLYDESANVWQSAGTGAAFCELARSFFAAFTDRQIKYYVERVAASSIGNYTSLQSFTQQLSEQSQAISDHAFEISKLTQSFAAGWFNKNAVSSLPVANQVQDFLSLSFNKLREELRREVEGK
jgi:hypothetical protein